MSRNITRMFLVLIFLLLFTRVALAQSNKTNIYFFWGEGCPHCASEDKFLQELELKFPEVNIYKYEVWKNPENRNYLIKIGESLKLDISGVPLTVIGDKTFVGFSESINSKQIEDRLEYCLSNECPDTVSGIVGLDDGSLSSPTTTNQFNDSVYQAQSNSEDSQNRENADTINLPIVGEIDPSSLSLGLFTILLGALDGFNPCAMWTLLFLISLLLGMKDTKRRWILGTVFIVSSAFVYFVFMAAWLNIILFVGFIVWVRILIGTVALGGGAYNLREYYTNKDGGCKVTGGEQRQLVFDRLRRVTQQKSFVLALVGIILLAFAVNLVELICSAGLPVVFTQVLAMSDLARWEYYSYMILYIFIFMLDDLFIFFTAMITLQVTGISTKYSRYSHLIGGFLMIIIGLLLLLKPELLMFG